MFPVLLKDMKRSDLALILGKVGNDNTPIFLLGVKLLKKPSLVNLTFYVSSPVRS